MIYSEEESQTETDSFDQRMVKSFVDNPGRQQQKGVASLVQNQASYVRINDLKSKQLGFVDDEEDEDV